MINQMKQTQNILILNIKIVNVVMDLLRIVRVKLVNFQDNAIVYLQIQLKNKNNYNKKLMPTMRFMINFSKNKLKNLKIQKNDFYLKMQII